MKDEIDVTDDRQMEITNQPLLTNVPEQVLVFLTEKAILADLS
jgi:hypothetical protein